MATSVSISKVSDTLQSYPISAGMGVLVGSTEFKVDSAVHLGGLTAIVTDMNFSGIYFQSLYSQTPPFYISTTTGVSQLLSGVVFECTKGDINADTILTLSSIALSGLGYTRVEVNTTASTSTTMTAINVPFQGYVCNFEQKRLYTEGYI